MPVRPILAAAAVLMLALVYLALPPAARQLAGEDTDLAAGIRGAVHVHTNRSDGSGTVDDVAAAASRAGLDFIVLTDHGDGRRPPDPPAYRHDVLVIDAVEISTDDGHLVAIGLPRAPYPLGGEGRDVAEDVARLGGLAIAAHPDSPRTALRWRDWAVPLDGLEWINGDSIWRDERLPALLRALVTYPVRRAESIAGLIDRPDALLQQWDRLTQERRVSALAAADAHARIGVRAEHQRGWGPGVPVPGYASMFRAFSVVLPDVALTGEAAPDAAAVITAMRAGRMYSVVDGLAGPGIMAFAASSGVHRARAGDALPLDGPVAISLATNAPASARLTLLRNGVPVAHASGPRLEYTAPAEPGVFRAEVSLADGGGRPAVPWMLSNPIYVGRSDVERPAVRRRWPVRVAAGWGRADAVWGIETSQHAKGAVDRVPASGEVLFRYALGGIDAEDAFVAFATADAGRLAEFEALAFTAHADRPTRVSVQVRIIAEGRLERWHRSVYLDERPREIVVDFGDMRPRGEVTSGHPDLTQADSVLFVVDTVNTELGTTGRIFVGSVHYARSER